jgi:hypothetical protein
MEPELWKKLSVLEDHGEDKEKNEREHGRRIPDVYIAHLIKNAFKMDVSFKEIQRVISLVDCNGFYGSRAMHIVNGGPTLV